MSMQTVVWSPLFCASALFTFRWFFFFFFFSYRVAGSGLQEIVELVHAHNAVVHILSGKAYAHSVRAHLLVVICWLMLLWTLSSLQTRSRFHRFRRRSSDSCTGKRRRNCRRGENAPHSLFTSVSVCVSDFAFPPWSWCHGGKRKDKVLDIKALQDVFGTIVCQNILLHV